MNHIDCDADNYLCQFCGQIKCGKCSPSRWVQGKGIQCCDCQPPMSLYEYCRQESGLEGQQLRDYINRHYGHG